LLGLAALVLTVGGARLASTVQRAHAEGISYSSTNYLDSLVTARLRDLPGEAAVYSNAPDGIYVLTGRQAFALPDATNLTETTALLEEQLRDDTPVYVAHYNDPDIAYRELHPFALAPSEWLRELARDASGALYRVERP
jgi:hypothetical protein